MLKLSNNGKYNMVLKMLIFIVFVIATMIVIIAVKNNFGKKLRESNAKKNTVMKKEEKANKYHNINLNLKNNIKKIKDVFSDRCVFVGEDDEKNKIIKIGNNLKEIENDYYDICFQILCEELVSKDSNDTIMKVYVKKLWKSMETIDMNLLYEEEYVKKLVNVIEILLQQEFSSSDNEKLIEYVIKAYDYVKIDDNRVDIDKDKYVFKKTEFGNWFFMVASRNNELVINIM